MSQKLSEIIKEKNTIHSYLEIYEKIFFQFIDLPVTVVKVGIGQDGASLDFLSKIFEKGRIIGIEINMDFFLRKMIEKSSVQIIFHDAYDEKWVNMFFRPLSLDILIDGPHTLESQIKCIFYYSYKIKTGGYLIIENIQNFDKDKDILINSFTDEQKQFVTFEDRRKIKNRYDDVLLIYNPTIKFKPQVVIYGHPLASHTHSYIHYSFDKTFKYLNYSTFWVKNLSELKKEKWNRNKPTIFITEGQVDDDIPLSENYFYLLHNCNLRKYDCANVRYLKIQKYDSECKEEISSNNYTFFKNKTIYQPWATDLLPHEIETQIKSLKENFEKRKKNKSIYFIGSYGEGLYGNKEQIDFYELSIYLDYILVKETSLNLTFDKEHSLLQSSLICPTIVGEWQKKNNYIPCRAFKTISSGNLLITNSKAVKKLFPNCVYSDDESQLFDLSLKAIQDKECLNKIIKEMENVKDNHTYINRIQEIMKLVEQLF